jgi:hypothetical protein
MHQTSTLDWCFELLQSVRSMGRGNKPAMEANLVHYNRSGCNQPIGFMGDADGNPRLYRCPHRTTGRGAGAHTPRHSATNPVTRLDVLRQLGLEADGSRKKKGRRAAKTDRYGEHLLQVLRSAGNDWNAGRRVGVAPNPIYGRLVLLGAISLRRNSAGGWPTRPQCVRSSFDNGRRSPTSPTVWPARFGRNQRGQQHQTPRVTRSHRVGHGFREMSADSFRR